MKASESLPRSRRWKRRGWKIFGYSAVMGAGTALFVLSPAPLVTPLIFGLPLAIPFWLAGAIMGVVERHKASRLAAEIAREVEQREASRRCMGPSCRDAATHRSADGPWIWCEAHAGPQDVRLSIPVDRSGPFGGRMPS